MMVAGIRHGMEKWIRSPMREAFQHWLHSRARRLSANYDVSRTIALASSPRGGSTWLAQCLASIPGYFPVHEPLFIEFNPQCLEHGIGWDTYIPPGKEEPRQIEYLRRVLSWDNMPPVTMFASPRNFHRYLRSRGFFIKFVNANMLLPTLYRHFQFRSILLIRHPCAVVNSQMLHPAWKRTMERYRFPESVGQEYPHLLELHQSLKEKEEVLALRWAIQTYIPLSQPRPHPWRLTTYEWLVRDQEQELHRLFDFLGEPMPEAAKKLLHKPSGSTRKGSNVLEGKDPLVGWKEKLTPAQIDRILSVVHRAGITAYTDDLVCDPDQLYPTSSMVRGESSAS